MLSGSGRRAKGFFHIGKENRTTALNVAKTGLTLTNAAVSNIPIAGPVIGPLTELVKQLEVSPLRPLADAHRLTIADPYL